MVAPNGARRTQTDHSELPITPEELALCAEDCVRAGANAFHLHVRGPQQEHSLDVDRYRAAIAAIRAKCPDLPIQCTTEAAGIFSTAQQFEMVRALRPQWVSFSLNEMMRDGQDAGLAFLDWARAARIRIQFILYTPADIEAFAELAHRGHLGSERPHLIIVAGRYGVETRSLDQFETLYDTLRTAGLDQTSEWMTCAFGRDEMACLTCALSLGSHARVGFENAIVDEDGRPAKNNAERVQNVRKIVDRLGLKRARLRDVAAQLRTD